MKSQNLNGEYCMSCAAILDDVQRNHRRVIVLDSQCLMQFQQSGDASRLEENVKMKEDPKPHAAPAIPAQAHKQETAKVQETVRTKASAKAAQTKKR